MELHDHHLTWYYFSSLQNFYLTVLVFVALCLFDLKIGNCVLTASLFYDFVSFLIKLIPPKNQLLYCSRSVKIVDLSITSAQQTTVLCSASLRAAIHRLSTRKRHRQHFPECTLHLPSRGISWQSDLHLVLGGG